MTSSRRAITIRRDLQVPVRLSQESLFGFLSNTRLPVVSSVAAFIRWISLGLVVAGVVHGVFCLLVYEHPWWSAELPWSGALPAFASAPLFAAAFRYWRLRRLQRASFAMFVGLFTLSILANWPRGAFSPAWYLHPLLSLLATVCLGVVPGLCLTLGAVVSMLGATWVVHAGESDALVDVWVHSTSLASLTLASSLSGAITNRLVFLALVTAEAQRRKNFETSRALRYRERLLRHALRVETVGDLAGLVCHQLRNAYQILIGHVSLAETADEPERLRRLGLIEETLRDTQPLLDELMRMAHPDEGRTTACDLNLVLRGFYEQASHVLPKTIEVTCTVADEPQWCVLNPQGLTHALWNMVINARQAMGGSGRIDLRCVAERNQVWIEVADTGPGIPIEVRDKIFDPYFTTKPPGQGTGLGLTAVARFVRSSNGVIQVLCENGTTFRMRFPRSVATQSQTA